MRSAAAALGALALASAIAMGCQAGQRRQWVVRVTTDAPVPGWGDRVLVEVLDYAGNLACDGCRREIAVFADGHGGLSVPFTFGVAPPANREDAVLRVRARLYRRSQAGADGLPVGTELIDQVAILPPLTSETTLVETVTVVLHASCFGTPPDVRARRSCLGNGFGKISDEELLTDTSRDTLPGDILKFPLAFGGIRCPDVAAPEGMVCIQPYFHLNGSAESVGVDTDFPTQPMRLYKGTWIFPVLVDKDEMTVGTARALVGAGKIAAGAGALLTKGDPGVPDACTFLGASNPANDAEPVNCISHATAERACAALGKELISERDWEAAASNLGVKTIYPWGDTRPTCATAIVSADATCARTKPVAGGADADVTALGIRNLGGNLSEWVSGIFVPYDDACWGPTTEPDECATDLRILDWKGPWGHRGGSYARAATSAASFARFASPDGAPNPQIGVRCAKKVLQ